MQLVTGSEWEAGRGQGGRRENGDGLGGGSRLPHTLCIICSETASRALGRRYFFPFTHLCRPAPPNRLLLFSLSHEVASSPFASTVSIQGEEPGVCKGGRRLGYRGCGSLKGGNLWPCCTHSWKKPALSFSF